MLLEATWLAALVLGAPVTEQTSVAVLPVQVQGKVEDQARERLANAVNDGLEHGRIAIRPAERGECADPACFADIAAGADVAFVLLAEVALVEFNYDLKVTLFQGKDGSVVSTAEQRCELCGAEEAAVAIKGLADAMRSKMEKMTTRPELSIMTAPPGASVTVDGQVVGKTPIALELAPGPHDVVVYLEGHERRTLQWNAEMGTSDRRTFELTSIKLAKQKRAMLISGAVLLAGGVITIPPGAVLLSLHGDQYRRNCEVDINDMCPNTYDTLGGGLGLLVGGAVSAIVGATLVGLALRKKKRSARR